MLCLTCTTWRDDGTNPEPVPLPPDVHRATRPAPSLMTEAGRREVAYSRPVPHGRRWTVP